MKRIFNIFTLAIVSSFAFYSCSTDFELNADYDEIPVIFGVIDQSVDTQFVKINKSFIGNGDNNTYAAINDSSLYTNVVAYVEENIDGVITNTFNLEEKWVGNLDAGIFYTDSQKVFYFVPPTGLNEDATYKLVVNTAEEAEPITAETEMIKGSDLDFDFLFTNLLALSGVQFADASSLSSNKYLSITPRWKSVYNGKKYELAMRFHYREITTSNDTIYSYIDWNLGAQEANSITQSEDMSRLIDGGSFFETVHNKLKNYAYEADVVKRIVGNVEFIITVANENLHTYIQVNEPSTGVVTERPIFTNVEGGVGIFASRYSTSLTSYLNSHSTNVLCAGPTTSAYKFCMSSSSDPNNILTTYPAIACP